MGDLDLYRRQASRYERTQFSIERVFKVGNFEMQTKQPFGIAELAQ